MLLKLLLCVRVPLPTARMRPPVGGGVVVVGVAAVARSSKAVVVREPPSGVGSVRSVPAGGEQAVNSLCSSASLSVSLATAGIQHALKYRKFLLDLITRHQT